MIYRIVDVNLNRITEALRVIEDINRFHLNNKKNTLQIKNFRHKIFQTFKHFNIITFRDIKNDKGKFLNTYEEFKRENLIEIIQANCKRIQESSRVLEEMLKLENPQHAKFFKNIRFYFYKLEKEMLLSFKKPFNLNLYAIIDTAFVHPTKIEKTVYDIIKGGATIIQLRAKTPCASLLNIAKKIKKITKKYNIPFIINDRIDIAIASDADGVHVGKNDLTPDVIRKKFLFHKIIGYSVTCEKEIKEGIKFKADYIGLGPIFPSETKKDAGKPLGLEKTSYLYQKYNKRIPIVILGGINTNNISACLEKKIKNFAFISEILLSKNIKKTTSQIKNLITGDKK